MRRRALLTALGLALAGCSGDGNGTTDAGPGSDTDTAAPTSTPTPTQTRTTTETATRTPTQTRTTTETATQTPTPTPTTETATQTPTSTPTTETATRTPTPTPTPTETPPAQVVTVAPEGALRFEPRTFSVAVGETVRWEWAATGHNVVADSVPGGADWTGTPNAPDDLYSKGYSDEHTFEVAGDYEYYCAPHRSCCDMVGSFTVV